MLSENVSGMTRLHPVLEGGLNNGLLEGMDESN